MDIQKLFICPVCKTALSVLKCPKCDGEYRFGHGVYDLISATLSANQEIFWQITDEMLDDDKALDFTAREKMKKEIDSYKNSETLVAQKKLDELIAGELRALSGAVCDLATGMGDMLQKLLNTRNTDIIIATDISPRVLAWTRKLKRTDDSRVFYVASDGRYMSLLDNSFDYVTSLAGFGNIPEGEKVAEEIFRILKSGGQLIIQGAYLERGSRSHELAKRLGLEEGLLEENLLSALSVAGFINVKSIVAAEAVWAENPYDRLPVAGDTQRYCLIKAEKPNA